MAVRWEGSEQSLLQTVTQSLWRNSDLYSVNLSNQNKDLIASIALSSGKPWAALLNIPIQAGQLPIVIAKLTMLLAINAIPRPVLPCDIPNPTEISNYSSFPTTAFLYQNP